MSSNSSPAALGQKKSKKQLKIEAAAKAAEEYNNELIAKARARQAAIAAEKKAEEEARRKVREEQEELERLQREQLEQEARERRAQRERALKIEAQRREAARIQAIIDGAREQIELGCAKPQGDNRPYPNRVLNPAPHSTLRKLYNAVLDTLDKALPFEENVERSFMVECTKQTNWRHVVPFCGFQRRSHCSHSTRVLCHPC